jgi:single-stranded-DNA-specific exonuclease
VLDAEIPLNVLTPRLLRDLDHLEPYGMDNSRPLFLAAGLQVVGTPTLVGGGERHLSFRVRHHGITLRAIAFNMAERVQELMSAEGYCCLAFSPRLNEWQGMRRVDLEVVDFQPGGQARFA